MYTLIFSAPIRKIHCLHQTSAVHTVMSWHLSFHLSVVEQFPVVEALSGALESFYCRMIKTLNIFFKIKKYAKK